MLTVVTVSHYVRVRTDKVSRDIILILNNQLINNVLPHLSSWVFFSAMSECICLFCASLCLAIDCK